MSALTGMLRLDDLDFSLPPHLIAQEPLSDRASARLLVVDRTTGALTDRHVSDLPELLRPDDVLVINDTKVIPARLFGRKSDTGARIEVLLLEPLAEGEWRVLVRPGRRMPVGTTVVFETDETACEVAVTGVDTDGTRRMRFPAEVSVLELARQIGYMPLPPYIKRPTEQPVDRQRYQTVFAKTEGAVAAPTAGLHFTPQLLSDLESKGIEVLRITLHVGLGTFAPLTDRELETGRLHAERYCITADVAGRLNAARETGRRIVAVGSTSTRVLETAARAAGEGPIEAVESRTDLFLQPGDAFQLVGAMLTNFHLPRSSLFALVCAFGGAELLRDAYTHAIAVEYRFYSYGDAMLIV